jgi:hypothetical protein
MIDDLRKIASEIKDKKERERFLLRINKISEDLASRNYLLLDVNEMNSIFNNEDVITTPSDDLVTKITLDKND